MIFLAICTSSAKNKKIKAEKQSNNRKMDSEIIEPFLRDLLSNLYN